MARKSRTAVLKRQREVKKAEKAAQKREKREARQSSPTQDQESLIATAEDLEIYHTVRDLFDAARPDDRPVRLLGVAVAPRPAAASPKAATPLAVRPSRRY